MTIIHRLTQFIKESHKDQKRKFTGEPYYEHPLRVMINTKQYTRCLTTLATCLLHDVIEDTNTTEDTIKNFIIENWTQKDSELYLWDFYRVKKKGVKTNNYDLTDNPELIRDVFIQSVLDSLVFLTKEPNMSKEDYNKRFENADCHTKLIKMMDICDNCSTINQYDKKWGMKYVQGKANMLYLLFTPNFVDAYEYTTKLLIKELK